ncbi:MAG: ATP-binding cassette domain-containing protein [Bacteroidota bacterium]
MLEIKDISKQFGDFSLLNISFTVEEGDYFVLLGESGAGKSVILELIAGMEKVDTGSIYFKGKDITRQAIQDRGFSMVFQDYAIFPHLTVANNIAYALKAKNYSKYEIKKRIATLAEEIEITHLLNRKPQGLSGGELQRLALARALAAEPLLLLLDEPLVSIDIQLKDQLRNLLRKLNRKGITILHVTHDFEEALALGNRIAVINQGNLISCGSCDEIFHAPNNPFIARFIGIKNFFPAILQTSSENENNKAILASGMKIEILSDLQHGEGFVIIPSDEIIIALEEQTSSASNCIKGVIMDIIPTVIGVDIIVDCGEIFHVTITRKSVEKLQLVQGKTIWISWKALVGRFIAN